MFGNGKTVDIDHTKFQDAVRKVRQLDDDAEWPKRDSLKYAPPAIQEQHAAPDPLTAVQELAVLCRTLTYGEMIEFAQGIGADPAKINSWARS